MTDEEINYRTMARQAERHLTTTRPTWEAAAPRLLPAYQRLTELLADFDEVAAQRAGLGSQGYTDAKDQAEAAAVAAAMRVVKGLRAVQLDAPSPDLLPVAGFSDSGLKRLRDEALVQALDAVRAAAPPHAAALAEVRVTPAHLAALDAATAAYRTLVGTPRGQVLQGSALRTTGKKLVAQLRDTFDTLDTRLDTLEDDFPELVAGYRQARLLVQAGRGPAAAVAIPTQA